MGSNKCIFVFFFVGFVGFFPDSALYLGTVLLVPGSIALILISIRSSFMLLNIMDKIINCLGYFIWYYWAFNTRSTRNCIDYLRGGYINEQGNHFDLDWVQLLLSPFAWSVVFLASKCYIYHQGFNILCF